VKGGVEERRGEGAEIRAEERIKEETSDESSDEKAADSR
jgi:hypothetical protein